MSRGGFISSDVIIVGGGPAGAACAWRLRQGGASCLILDRQPFPRAKPCAGWVTPQVWHDLGVSPDAYPHSLTVFRRMSITLGGAAFTLPTLQYAIRRIEFDHWLLQRAAAPFQVHLVRNIAPAVGGGYILDDAFFCRYLVGAGGSGCPVYQRLFKPVFPHHPQTQIVAMEAEFAAPIRDPRCRLWFMENHLPGYAWYVPKSGGVLNIGVGGKAAPLKARGDSLKNHWEALLQKLHRMGLLADDPPPPRAYTYFLRQPHPEVRLADALLTGDAAGLATRDMGEGIAPAIRSGLLAADAILHGSRDHQQLRGIPAYSFPSLLRLR